MKVRAWVLVVCVLPWRAFGQTPPDDPARRQLILEAGQAHDAGDHARALDLARRAGRIRMSPSLRAVIAQEEAALGQVVEAYRDAGACVREFDVDLTATRREQFLAQCRDLQRALAPRVGRLVVEVSDAAPGVRVRVEDGELPREQWGVEQVWPLGRVVVTGEAPGRTSFRREVNLNGGRVETVTVRLESAAATPRTAERPETRSRSPATSEQRVLPLPIRVEPPATTRQGVGAGLWVVMGLGAASFAAAGGFYALREGALSDRDGLCGSTAGDCTVATQGLAQQASEHQERASTFNTLTNVAIGVGGAVFAGGLVWWLIVRTNGSNERASATVTFNAGGGGMLVGVQGSM